MRTRQQKKLPEVCNNKYANTIVCATRPVFWSSGFWRRAQTDPLENHAIEQNMIMTLPQRKEKLML